MGLFDEIQGKSQRQQNMMAHFQKRSESSVSFNEVSVEKKTAPKAEKDKGLIIPPINYISDESNDAQSG